MRRSIIAHCKDIVRRLLRAPWGAHIGRGTVVARPWRWSNRGCVVLGRDVYVGRDSYLSPTTDYAGIAYAPRVEIGDGTYIGGFCQLHAIDRIEIGAECVLSEYVYISDSAHGLDCGPTPIMQQPLESKGPVRIGRRVFLGIRSTVLAGVELGDYCIVGAGSVVTRSFPAGSVIGGSPARLIRQMPGFEAEAEPAR